MKSTIMITALMSVLALPAAAQTTTTEGETPAVVTSDTKNAAVLVEGENSFTEAQAKDRITDAGYTGVSGLKLDDKGIWRATAMKSGKSVAVGLDYQGNVVSQ